MQPFFNQPTLYLLRYAYLVSTDTSQIEEDPLNVNHAEAVHESP